jgi:hypothetical protein
MSKDWIRWLKDYESASSPLARRLEVSNVTCVERRLVVTWALNARL